MKQLKYLVMCILVFTITNVNADVAKVYKWLCTQQNATTGLLPSQQYEDEGTYNASTYNNAMAAIVFTLKNDQAKAEKILDYYNNRLGTEFVEGFFQYRNSITGLPNADSDRWIGDNAWLAIAIHYYYVTYNDARYNNMLTAIIDLIVSRQQPDGCISAPAEANLDAYKVLKQNGRDAEASQIKACLDSNSNFGWRDTFLDLHSWRVQSLGPEYGFCLPDMERIDDESIRFKCTINYSGAKVTGFLPFTEKITCDGQNMADNIWTERTGQMAVSYYKAGYSGQGDFYVQGLEKLLFQHQDFPDTLTLSFLAKPDPICHDWVEVTKGHVAGACWYIFAKERFDPFDGKIIEPSGVINPAIKIEAENYDEKSGSVGLDYRGDISEGAAIHIAESNLSGDVKYKFNIIKPISYSKIRLRYADEKDGDICNIYLDDDPEPVIRLTTVNTGTWDDYIWTNELLLKNNLDPGLHTLKIEGIGMGTYGFTLDCLEINSDTSLTPTPTPPTSPPPVNGTVSVYRFYSEQLKKHFFTRDANEKDTIIATFPEDVWKYEGISWYVFPDSQNGTLPVYRFYSEQLQSHFFTTDENEKNTIIATFPVDVWRYEGVAWYVYTNYQQNSRAVYRFYSEQLKSHFYTMDENEKNAIIATFPEDVWRYEGIAYYAYP